MPSWFTALETDVTGPPRQSRLHLRQGASEAFRCAESLGNAGRSHQKACNSGELHCELATKVVLGKLLVFCAEDDAAVILVAPRTPMCRWIMARACPRVTAAAKVADQRCIGTDSRMGFQRQHITSFAIAVATHFK